MSVHEAAPAVGTITVSVRLFARYSEVSGTDTVSLELPSGATVAAAVAAVRSRIPNGHLLPERPLVAVNLAHVRAHHVLSDGDELGLLPPLAGG
jgi:sulfur-carrier protein